MAKNSRKEVALLLLRQVEQEKRAARQIVGATPDFAWPDTEQVFLNVEDLLSDPQLHQFMPTVLDPDARMDQFKAHIQSVGTRVESLHVVVELGMSEIAHAWTLVGNDQALQAAVRTGVHDLLEVPDGQISVADTKTRVNQILTTMYTALHVAAPAALDVAAVQMQLQHIWLSTTAWTSLVLVVWIIATLITGAMVMVLSKAGFGTPCDYALCLLWGLGLPAAGTQLNQLSGGGIGTKLGITLPKAEG